MDLLDNPFGRSYPSTHLSHPLDPILDELMFPSWTERVGGCVVYVDPMKMGNICGMCAWVDITSSGSL